MRTTVAMLTFRRPGDLADALPMLVDRVAEVEGAELLVVDNDEEPTARDAVAAWQGSVRYVHEPRPGIAAARNRALAEATGSDVVVFVDDDERPDPGWLGALLDAFDAYRSADCVAVAGPVLSVFDGPVDPWIEAGGFFTRLRHPSGARVRVAATNNLLLDLPWLRERGITFDEQFGITGGSDTVLSLRIEQAGGVIRWCDEAVVRDVVPPSRATRSWVLRRAYRMGNTGSRAEVHVTRGLPRVRARAVMVGRGLVRVAGGGARAAWGVLTRSARHRARGVRSAVRGAGMLTGAFGIVYAEYVRPAARPRAVHA